MPAKLHISIPEPCNMRWSDMTHVDDNKRHCGSCDRVITDFTQMSDDELISHFRSNAAPCGMFARHQLNRDITAQRKQRRPWLATALLPALLSLTEVSAQSKAPQQTMVVQSDSSLYGIRLSVSFPTFGDTIHVQGRVFGRIDSLTESPLPLAMMIFKTRKGTSHSCVSDTNGYFHIRLDTSALGDTVDAEVRYRNYQPAFTSLPLMRQVIMDAVEIVTREEDYVVGIHPGGDFYPEPHPPSRVRRFFHRLFHPRHWFHSGSNK